MVSDYFVYDYEEEEIDTYCAYTILYGDYSTCI